MANINFYKNELKFRRRALYHANMEYMSFLKTAVKSLRKEGFSLRKIVPILGISRERVRQVESMK